MIKRGSKVVWNRPAYNVRDNNDNKVRQPAKKFKGRCFGVLKRHDGETALLMRHVKSKMIEVPLNQLEEPAGGGNYD